MLVKFDHRRLGKSAAVPCGSLSDTVMRKESYTNGGVVIYNALSARGFERHFCTWCDEIGVVSGQSLQYPWRRLKGKGVEVEAAAGILLRVSKRAAGQIEIVIIQTDIGSEEVLLLRSHGIRNTVQLERPSGEILARFPAFGSVEIDLTVLSQAEARTLLAMLGAGLVRHARRVGIVARAIFPSAID